jgi:signal transduction histidine kinase
MAAIPIVIFDSGESQILRGALFDCPAEFFSLAQLAFYQSCKIGWSRCPLGYSVYAAFDSMGRKLVVPGIIVPDKQPPNRKFPNYPLRFSSDQIENFLRPHLGVSQEIRDQRDKEFKNLTHDLRAISTEIYHTALTVRNDAEKTGYGFLLNSLDSVLAAQQMMSLRLDIVDYESGLSAARPNEKISVFKKVDKVLRCFSNKMWDRKLSYRVEGSSYAFIFGPPIFEIVPFVIVENAVKYAPPNTEILIKFEEINNEIIVRFDSYGPLISESEMSRIFEQNFRGEAAASSRRSGSGIGLYAAKSLVESQFGGKIFANQLPNQLFNKGSYFYLTRFTIVLPEYKDTGASGLAKSRRHFFGR